MAETVQEPERKKKQHRSPAYPSMGLKAALGYVETIYKHERRSSAPVGVVVEHCGTDIKSSKGLRLIAAMKQFGLVVEEGSGDDRHVRLSDRALDIHLGDNLETKKTAISEAALTPPLHKKIWDHYAGKLPSDPTLKVYLLRQHDFNDLYVDSFIKQFKATLAFAKLAGDDTLTAIENGGDEVEDDDPSIENPPSSPKPPRIERNRTMTAGLKEDVFSLDDGALVVQWPERIHGASKDDIKDWLKLVGSKIARAVASEESAGPPLDDDQEDS